MSSLNTASAMLSFRPRAESAGVADLSLDFRAEPVHRWKRMPGCTIAPSRSKHTLVARGNSIYVFGGDDGHKMLNDLLKFDTEKKVWSKVATEGKPPSPRYHHSAVVFGNSMFVFGGYTGDLNSNSNLENRNDLFEYKFDANTWYEWNMVGERPVARSAHGACVFGDSLYIFAGYDGKARLNDMWRICLTDESSPGAGISPHTAPHEWKMVNQQGQHPPTCCNFPVAVARDSMYVFSGHSGAKTTNDLFEFNFGTSSWTRVLTRHVLHGGDPPPPRRFGHTMVHFDRHLYVYGGAADNTLPSDFFCYDLDSLTWKAVEIKSDSIVPAGRCFHACAVVNNGMYVFGGTVDFSQNFKSTDLFRFQFSVIPKCTLEDDFARMCVDKQLADMSFVVGPQSQQLQAHSAIVAARSPYLRQLILQKKGIVTPLSVDLVSASAGSEQAAIAATTNMAPAEASSSASAPQPPALLRKGSGPLERIAGMESFAGGDVSAELARSRSESNSSLNSTPSCNSNSGVATPSQPSIDGGAPSSSSSSVLASLSASSLPVPMPLHGSAAPTASLELRFPEANVRAFEIVVYFMYADHIPEREYNEDLGPENVEVITHVYELSLLFGLQRLERLCECLILASVNRRNVLSILRIVSSLKLSYLKSYCLNYVVRDSNYTEIVTSPEFEQLEQPLLVEIVRRHQMPRQRERTLRAVDSPVGSLSSDMADFLSGKTGKEFYDVTFLLNGVQIHAHKAILAARSDYFRGMFSSCMLEASAETLSVSIGDIIPSVQAFRTLLRYIYYGDVNMPPEDSMYLFSTPHYYGFKNDRLQVICKHNLEENVSASNVLQILEAADRIQAIDMKKHALYVIVDHFAKISQLPMMKTLKRELLLEILDALGAKMAACQCGAANPTLLPSAPGLASILPNGSSSSALGLGLPPGANDAPFVTKSEKGKEDKHKDKDKHRDRDRDRDRDRERSIASSVADDGMGTTGLVSTTLPGFASTFADDVNLSAFAPTLPSAASASSSSSGPSSVGVGTSSSAGSAMSLSAAKRARSPQQSSFV